MKIAILGYSGCGKSTLAAYLSAYYHIPLLYLDTVQFEADWKVRDKEEAVSIVTKFMENDNWVIDGNYASFLQSRRLKEADYIIYMAFSRWSCLLRALNRYHRYKNTERESMADGCIEKIDLAFIWWILYKGRTAKKKQYYNNILRTYSEKSIILKNQKQLDAFMADLSQLNKSTSTGSQ